MQSFGSIICIAAACLVLRCCGRQAALFFFTGGDGILQAALFTYRFSKRSCGRQAAKKKEMKVSLPRGAISERLPGDNRQPFMCVALANWACSGIVAAGVSLTNLGWASLDVLCCLYTVVCTCLCGWWVGFQGDPSADVRATCLSVTSTVTCSCVWVVRTPRYRSSMSNTQPG